MRTPDPLLMRWRLTWFGIALAVVIGVAELHAARPSVGPACPERPLAATLSAFHFSPGVEEHQSWIEFRVPEPDATRFILCLDGRVWETGIGETPRDGLVRVSIATRFVDAEWLLGQMASFEQVDRWTLGYTTYSLGRP